MAPVRDERAARLIFNLVPGLGPMRFGRLVERFGDPVAALAVPAEAWTDVEGFGAARARALHAACSAAAGAWEEELSAAEEAGVRVLIPSDEEFPEGLKALPDAPLLLYVRGDFRPVDALAVALVGTRRPTAYGRAAAERFARELAQAGVTLVSGLARGVDTAVHAAAVQQGARTIGVLGSGHKRFYPPENRALAEKMAARGAVVSEFPLATEPDRGHFPRRNRLIAALSLATVVVEAAEASGALITARLAAEQGKDVFAVPGPIFSEKSRGPHRLLKQGARLVEGAEDVLEEIQAFRDLIRTSRPPAPAPAAALTAPEEGLLRHITLEPAGLDALASRSGLGPAALASALLALELKGLVRSLPGRAYVRVEAAWN